MATEKVKSKEQSEAALGTRESGDGAGAANSQAAGRRISQDEFTSSVVMKSGVPGETQRSGLDGEELVSYTAPMDPTRKRVDVIVAVNGEMLRIRRGETVQIKRKFLTVLEQAARQEMEAYRVMEQAAKGSSV